MTKSAYRTRYYAPNQGRNAPQAQWAHCSHHPTRAPFSWSYPEDRKHARLPHGPHSCRPQSYSRYWQSLAQVYSNMNQPAESHRFLAEYYYAMGETYNAILQIRLAQESKGLNFQLSSILSERLSFFINQQQEAGSNH